MPTILIAKHDPNIAETLGRLFLAGGYTVIFASTAAAAVTFLRQVPVDVLVTTIALLETEVHDQTLFTFLERDERLARLPIVLIAPPHTQHTNGRYWNLRTIRTPFHPSRVLALTAQQLQARAA